MFRAVRQVPGLSEESLPNRLRGSALPSSPANLPWPQRWLKKYGSSVFRLKVPTLCPYRAFLSLSAFCFSWGAPSPCDWEGSSCYRGPRTVSPLPLNRSKGTCWTSLAARWGHSNPLECGVECGRSRGHPSGASSTVHMGLPLLPLQ